MTHHSLLLSEVIELANNNIKIDHSKIVVIFENSENVSSLLPLKKSDNLHILMYIATDPDVGYALYKKNEKYVLFDVYFTIKEISELGLSNFTKVENLCDVIDRGICKDFDIVNNFSCLRCIYLLMSDPILTMDGGKTC
ncbi:hypothetical protein [Methanoregula sp.]|jgi:hypothetical protein|uniref:hypothetical protein n=1 Tax=Methanoregula sp. TaxID=2052170 RepID=UPI0035642D5A